MTDNMNFKSFYTEAAKKLSDIHESTEDEIYTAFMDLLSAKGYKAEINVYLNGAKAQRRSENNNKIEAKTVNLANYTVVEFTSVVNDDTFTGFVNQRFTMSIFKSCLPNNVKTHLTKHEFDNFNEPNAYSYDITRQVTNNEGEKFYELILDNNVKLYSKNKWYFRGHSIAASVRSLSIPYQEATQALALAEKCMNITPFDKTFRNRINLYLYDREDTRNLLYKYYTSAKMRNVLFNMNSLKVKDTKPLVINNGIVSDLGTAYYSKRGISDIYRTIFNNCNTKKDDNYVIKNINTWCPADIAFYTPEFAQSLKAQERILHDLDDYKDFLDKATANRQLRLISLKMNSSIVRSYDLTNNKEKTIEVLSYVTHVTHGKIIVTVRLKEDTKINLIDIRFDVFNNADRSSIETTYRTKAVKYDNLTDMEIAEINTKLNTETVLGKALDGMNLFLDKTCKCKIDQDVLRMFPRYNIPGMDKFKNVDVMKYAMEPTKILYYSWLNIMGKVIKMPNSGIDTVEDFLIYTIMAGKKENYGMMNYFPIVYKVS